MERRTGRTQGNVSQPYCQLCREGLFYGVSVLRVSDDRAKRGSLEHLPPARMPACLPLSAAAEASNRGPSTLLNDGRDAEALPGAVFRVAQLLILKLTLFFFPSFIFFTGAKPRGLFVLLFLFSPPKKIFTRDFVSVPSLFISAPWMRVSQ